MGDTLAVAFAVVVAGVYWLFRYHPNWGRTRASIEADQRFYRAAAERRKALRQERIDTAAQRCGNVHGTVWIDDRDIGRRRSIRVDGRTVAFIVPSFEGPTHELRLPGAGRTTVARTGHVLLTLRRIRGETQSRNVWISADERASGTYIDVRTSAGVLKVRVPPGHPAGRILRLREAGPLPDAGTHEPPPSTRRGDVLLRVLYYTPVLQLRQSSPDELTTEQLALEAMARRRFDEFAKAIPAHFLSKPPLPVARVVDAFNLDGWTAVCACVIGHLEMAAYSIDPPTAESLPPRTAGRCESAVFRPSGRMTHRIAIDIGLIESPFAVAAVCAHELCHVISNEHLRSHESIAKRGVILEGSAVGSADIEQEEQRVDFMVCCVGLGHFQVYTRRTAEIHMGYYDQQLFERLIGVAMRLTNTRRSSGPRSSS